MVGEVGNLQESWKNSIVFHFKVKAAIMVSIYYNRQFSSKSVHFNSVSSVLENFVDNIKNDKL